MSEESDTPQNESPAEEAKRKFKEALERNAANAQSQQAHQSRAKIQGSGGNGPGGKNKKVRRKTG